MQCSELIARDTKVVDDKRRYTDTTVISFVFSCSLVIMKTRINVFMTDRWRSIIIVTVSDSNDASKPPLNFKGLFAVTCKFSDRVTVS